MPSRRTSIKLLALILVLTMSSMMGLFSPTGEEASQNEFYELDDGSIIEIGPDEVLYRYDLSASPTSVNGIGYALNGSEYGTRVDTYSESSMLYDSSGGTTTGTDLTVPIGDGWESYQVTTTVTELTENRTWVVNSGFDDTSQWTFSTSHATTGFSGNNRIQVFSNTGTYATQWGSYGTGNGQFIDPYGIAINGSDYIYVADTGNNRIQYFDSAGNYEGQWGTFGSASGEFDNPMGIAINSTGYVYVADNGNNRIQIFTSDGTYVSEFGQDGNGNGEFFGPVGIAISSNGVYVVDQGNFRVQIFDSVGTYSAQFGGYGTGGGNFICPSGIAINQATGDVYVSDATMYYNNNYGISQFSSAGAYIDQVTQHRRNYAINTDTTRDPRGLAVDGSGDVFICDSGDHRILVYDSGIDTHQYNWGSRGSGNGQFLFNYGVAINSTGYVYTLESGGHMKLNARWESDGHGTGNPALSLIMDGYWYDDPDSTYGYWYNLDDKTFASQNLNINRGDVTWIGVSVDHWADLRGWGIMGGFFEMYVADGDPDSGGNYLWRRSLEDPTLATNTWYSTGLVEASTTAVNPNDLDLTLGLRVTQKEWYRNNDIRPEVRFDNIHVYVKAKVKPSQINMEMNGNTVSDTGGPSVFGTGFATYTASPTWMDTAFANFTWTPIPATPDPDRDISIEFDVDVKAFAKKHGGTTVYDTLFNSGERYSVTNASNVKWTTNYYAAVPDGYEPEYSFNISTPLNRDITFVAEPFDRATNLSSGWNQGQPGDGVVNVSVFDITTTYQNGFWLLKGNSPNMITNLEVWDSTQSQWTTTRTFRANEPTRFRASVPSTYEGDLVTFDVYDSSDSLWYSLSATVSSGYAITDYVYLEANNASVGNWEVQAVVNDGISSSNEIHNIGFFRRSFEIDHSTEMLVKYPIGSETSWSKDVTYGDVVLLQLQINDTDADTLVADGFMTYDWAAGTGIVSNMGTGEYSVSLDTTLLSGNGQYPIQLDWSKDNYDSVNEVFILNVIYTTEFFSNDAPGINIPSGYVAEMEVYYEDQLGQPITGASIVTNWTYSSYNVDPVIGQPGYYKISFNTSGVSLGLYDLNITASNDYCESRTIFLSVQVRDVHTSVIRSTSFVSIPVGYTGTLTVTYTDTDANEPIQFAESEISCNWTEFHSLGDTNYTVTETSPGEYTIELISFNDDPLGSFTVIFDIERYGSQNHTFSITVELRTHLTSFELVNPIDPTPYTANVEATVLYYDSDVDAGITNGTLNDFAVLINVTSDGSPITFSVVNGSNPGEYIILVPADQWGAIGERNLTIEIFWTGITEKYEDLVIETSVTITSTPTDIFIGDSPIMTPYLEDLSFSIIYYDTANATGIVNSTGAYAGNVHIYITVLTAGETLTQSDFTITEIDPFNNSGEYRFEFNTSLLSGLVGCQLRIMFNWTNGELPLYENQSIVITVYSTYRQTTAEWNPLPVTPYDELVNLTLVYKDVLSDDSIRNSTKLIISIQEAITYQIFYEGDITGVFKIELDTSSWTPGTYTFHIDITWVGSPFYQNKSSIAVQINVRERYTELTHGTFSPIQYQNNLTLLFTYTDTDDGTSLGMNNAILTLNSSLSGYYYFVDNGDGTYTLHLNTTGFGNIGTYVVSVDAIYGGARYATDASDLFYITITNRRAQLTSELPDLTPYLSLANITIYYTDDNTGTGIIGTTISATCSEATLVLNDNYWYVDQGDGYYVISIDTEALGNFGTYTISVTADYTGSPFYQSRSRDVNIEVSRRIVSLIVSKSPLNTPFGENVSFQITITDSLLNSPIDINKSSLILTHIGSVEILPSQYSFTGSSGTYTISILSTILTSTLESGHEISVRFYWSDIEPFYANATVSTEVTITSRPTQVAVLSTPPAYFTLNATATVSYSDYIDGIGIENASVSISCSNITPIQYWIINNFDGTYGVKINTTKLLTLGRFIFYANFSWTGTPYYQNKTLLRFTIIVNPVSTTLSFAVSDESTNYLGDIIIGNLTFINQISGDGIEAADIQSNWNSLYGTSITIIELGDGIYNITIETTGLDAEIYSFSLTAEKYLHVNRTILADIILAPVPVLMDIDATPTEPIWGESMEFSVNLTDARDGSAIINASVNMTISGQYYDLIEVAPGIYNRTLLSSSFNAGEYSITFSSSLLNHESRQRDFQIKIAKVSTSINADLDSYVTVNGQTVTVEVEYVIQSDSSPISSGIVTYTWTGGAGQIFWNAIESKYVGQFTISGVTVGSHQVQVSASSTNYKTVTTQLTIEVSEASTELSVLNDISVLPAVYGDEVNVTVYLNNTDLNLPVLNSTLTYSVGTIVGNMTELGNGWYSAMVPTSSIAISEWILTVSSSQSGYQPASIEVTLDVTPIPTKIEIIGPALLTVFHGENATFTLYYNNTHSNIGIDNATTNFVFEGFSGLLVNEGGGNYSLTLNSSIVIAGSSARRISITMRKDNHAYAFTNVKLIVKPISTTIDGPEEITYPVGDDYSVSFDYLDSLHDELISGATASAIWEFGNAILEDLGNGTYVFSPSATGIDRLEIKDEPYRVRISISKLNYSQTEIILNLVIREIATELTYEPLPPSVFAGNILFVRVTYYDLDHATAIPNANNATTNPGLTRILDREIDYGNGTYVFAFIPPGVATYELTVTMSLNDYESQTVNIVIFSEIPPEQQALVTGFRNIAIAVIGFAILAAVYIRVLSVPKQVRKIQKMINTISKGGIPEPYDTSDRREMLLSMMNQDLVPVGIIKTSDDISRSTIQVEILDVEELLHELATVVGLTEDDIQTLRINLEAMRPSERAGFISEVIRQERSRRAKELAEETAAESADEDVEQKLTDAELDDLREKLRKMGISESEVEIMIEQAKELSKAEVEALIDQIGGMD
ncbi:MAG: hypothetical protein GF411_03610 [Candidatus Lokiarchaeota archaeon]|nr:hypothetical protein [Candidatus Lokiarchaeota archaeon]